jgi:hypothetical protein
MRMGKRDRNAAAAETVIAVDIRFLAKEIRKMSAREDPDGNLLADEINAIASRAGSTTASVLRTLARHVVELENSGDLDGNLVADQLERIEKAILGKKKPAELGPPGQRDPVTGRRIVQVRRMTDDEASNEGWSQSTTVLVLEDGTLLYASRDDEGNGPGVLFGIKAKGGGSFGFPSYQSNKGRKR